MKCRIGNQPTLYANSLKSILRLLLVVALSQIGYAQWPTNPDYGLEIDQGEWLNTISDGQGGAYIVVSDYVGTVTCTRVDHRGDFVFGPLELDAEWGAYISGHRFPKISLSPDSCLIVSYSDVYYHWETVYDANIRVQKISPIGQKLWGEGVRLTPDEASGSSDNRSVFSSSIADHIGGAYVLWGDGRDDNDRMWIQRISPDGIVLWDSLGVLLGLPSREIRYLNLTSSDELLVVCATEAITALLIDTSGVIIPESAYSFNLGNIGSFKLDNNDNLFFMNYHDRAFKTDLSFQHVWSDSGVSISDTTDFIFDLIPVGDGGAVIQYRKEDVTDRNFSQWVNSDGSLKYGPEGVFSLAADGSGSPTVMSDDSSFITVHHTGHVNAHLAQRVSSSGSLLWANPIAVTPSTESSYFRSTAVPDGNGGVIYVYHNDYHVYAVQLGKTGRLGSTTSIYDSPNLPEKKSLVSIYPNPFNPSTTIEYSLSMLTNITLTIFDLTGRLIETLVSEVQGPGDYLIQWDGMTPTGLMAESGVYLVVLKTDVRTEAKKMTYLR